MALCWASLSGQEQQEAFDALDDWVDWLVDRYQLDHRVVPPCWLEHTALLEELSALRTAWLEAFCITASGRDPLDWHAAFATARQRLSDWAARTGCRPGEHRA
jgi:alpha-L-arabinofuranosidase